MNKEARQRNNNSALIRLSLRQVVYKTKIVRNLSPHFPHFLLLSKCNIKIADHFCWKYLVKLTQIDLPSVLNLNVNLRTEVKIKQQHTLYSKPWSLYFFPWIIKALLGLMIFELFLKNQKFLNITTLYFPPSYLMVIEPKESFLTLTRS